MGANSAITWTTHTFNPWRGCTKVSDGCKHCYAETLSGRNPKVLGVWGPTGARVVAAEAYWRQPIKWDAAAAEAGERHRVFCASLADVYEGDDTMPEETAPVVLKSRLRLFDLIDRTPNLDWLLVTKRPENIRRMTPVRVVVEGRGVKYRHNLWLLTSVENQGAADKRISELLQCRDLAPVLGLSCEPLLGPIDLSRYLGEIPVNGQGTPILSGEGLNSPFALRNRFLHWLIAGSESGPRRRPSDLAWHRSLRDQCAAAGVSYFQKQIEVDGKITDDVTKFPSDLRVQEFPTR